MKKSYTLLSAGLFKLNKFSYLKLFFKFLLTAVITVLYALSASSQNANLDSNNNKVENKVMNKITQERFQFTRDVYNVFNKDNMGVLDTFYTTDVEFADPLGSIKGLDKIKKYYGEMYQNVTEIKFDFKEAICEGDSCFFTWTMTLRAKGLKGGEPVTSVGGSLLKFNEKKLVYYHRDYFDMGEFIYEHIPVLGFVVKKIKSSMAHKD